MNINKLISVSAIFLYASFLCCTDACAQYGGMGGGMGGGRRGMTQDRSTRPAVAPTESGHTQFTWLEQVSTQINELQVDLKFSREQAPAWQWCAQSLSFYLEEVHSSPMPAEAGKSASGMQLIRQVVDRSRNRYGLVEDFEASARSLFVQLTATQQNVFDARISQWRFLQVRAE